MNNAQIEESIHKAFQVLDRVSGDGKLIRCERRMNDALVSVFYFDVSDIDLDQGFNLEAFLDTHIANDFHRNRGQVQWNFYMVFVVNDEKHERLKPRGLFDSIESNRSYARKFVVNETRLDDFLRHTLTANSGPSQKFADFSLRWKQKLDESGFDSLYSDAPRAQLIRKFRVGQFEQSPRGSTVEIDSLEFKLARISSLTIERYRSRIAAGCFPLKQVNLLTGPNGAGKTSFLEAIELCICGKTAQNGVEPEEADLSLGYLGGTVDKYPCSATNRDQFYRTRDRLLYGRHYTRDNHLATAFSRYNFFATDAAFRLAHQDTAQEISKALTDFIVGPEVTALDERLKKFEDDLSRDISSLNSEIEKIKKEYSAVVESVDRAIKTSLLLDSEQVKLQECLRNVPLKSEHASQIESLPDLRNLLARIAPSIDSLVGTVDWIRPLTIAQAQRERQELRSVTEQSDNLLASLEVLRQRGTIAEVEIANSEVTIDRLKRYVQYLEIESTGQISGIGRRIDSLRSTIRQGANLRIAIEQCENLAKKFSGKTISDATQEIASRSRSLSELLKKLKDRLDHANAKASKARTQLLILRGQALDILNAEGALGDCPLCQTTHGPEKLRQLIESIGSETPDALEVSKILAEQKKLELEAESVATHSKLIDSVRTTWVNSAPPGLCDITKSSFADALRELGAFQIEVTKAHADLETLDTLKRTLEEQGLSEANFLELQRNIPEELRSSDGQLERPTREMAEVLSKRVATLEEDRKKLAHETEQQNEKLKQLLLGHFKGLQELPYILKVLPDRTTKLESAIGRLASLGDELLIGADDDLQALGTSLRIELKKIEDFLLLMGKARESSEAVKRDTEKLLELKQTLPIKEAERTNLTRVLDVINDILLNESVEKNMRTFLHDYKQSIMDIFASIHTPREFSGILLGEGGIEDVRLVRANGDTVTLKQISTGQRSALALSIFLALQRSVHAKADLILIDDPVAHVDDLNSLSFLDHLRNLAINGAQIVFATADHKMAKLFEMKFAFLEGAGAFQRLDFQIDGKVLNKGEPAAAGQGTLH